MHPNHLETVFKALNQAGVRYLVVGGLAVMAHGYVRVTRDLDLVLALDGKNPEDALRAFERLGYGPNLPVELMDFADPEKRRQWKAEKGMQVYQLVSDSLVDCPIDLFVDEPFAFSEMHEARADYVLSEEVTLPVVGLAHLKAMKQAAGRPRDLLDLDELERLSDNDG